MTLFCAIASLAKKCSCERASCVRAMLDACSFSGPRASSEPFARSASARHGRATLHAISLGITSHSPSLAMIKHSSSAVLSNSQITGSYITKAFRYLSPNATIKNIQGNWWNELNRQSTCEEFTCDAGKFVMMYLTKWLKSIAFQLSQNWNLQQS